MDSPAPLILASTSPRRKLLLEEARVHFEVVRPSIDDSELRSDGCAAQQWVVALAHLKARDVADRHCGRTVLGADTVVVKNGSIIGQPLDDADARRIIELLSGGSHRVVTGVAILSDGRRLLLADSARVRVGSLDPRAIAEYVKCGSWAGKAGGYNLCERIDAGWPITYEGDASTIMGLPMKRLSRVLPSYGFEIVVPRPGGRER